MNRWFGRRFSYAEVLALLASVSVSPEQLKEDAAMQRAMSMEHSREVTLQAEELEAEAKSKREEASALREQADLLASAIKKMD